MWLELGDSGRIGDPRERTDGARPCRCVNNLDIIQDAKRDCEVTDVN